MNTPLLQIDQLITAFDTEEGRLRAVDGISFNLAADRTLGLVGESGCGKSVTALSIMRLLPQPAGRIESCSRARTSSACRPRKCTLCVAIALP